MASHYSFEAIVPGAELSIPAAQTFLERSKAKALLEAREVIRRVSRGMGMLNPRWCQSESTVGKRDSVEVNRKALAGR